MLLRSALAVLLTPALARAATNPDWLTPIAPFQIADNLYYVGSKDLASYLIVTPAGDILLNSSLEASPPLIAKSIARLGFHLTDVKILLISHAHSDHAAGSARIVQLTHAKYMVMEGDVPVVESGGARDFAYPKDRYLATKVDRVLHDNDEVRLGNVVLVAHKTAGHTPGCTTWTLRTTLEGHPEDVVIVGSWNVNPGFRLVDHPGRPASYPTIAEDYRRSFETLAKLPCDIPLGAHGLYFDMLQKLAKAKSDPSRSVWIDPDGYRVEVADRRRAFETELRKQQQEHP